MMSGRARVASLQLLLSTVAFAARAQRVLDLYGGVAPAGTADVTVKEFAPFLSDATAQRTVSFDTSATFGARLGYWFPGPAWFGIGVDLSFIRASRNDVNLGAIPLSGLLMFRWPQSESQPILKLPVEPYAAIGPSYILLPELRIDFRPAVAEKVSESPKDAVGIDFRGGLAWNVSSNFAFFTEYRFIRFHAEFEQRGCLTFGCALINVIAPAAGVTEATRRKADATVDSHHFLLGISFR